MTKHAGRPQESADPGWDAGPNARWGHGNERLVLPNGPVVVRRGGRVVIADLDAPSPPARRRSFVARVVAWLWRVLR